MGQNDQDNKHNQKLQGVLIAESFTSTFDPITLDESTPKVLCPLNNVTMLDYSMEYMVGAGVEEIYIFCVRGKDAIESYLREQNYLSSSSSSSGSGRISNDGDVDGVGGGVGDVGGGDGDHGDEEDDDDYFNNNNGNNNSNSNRRSSSRTSSYSSIKVEVIRDTSVTDVGGALRELYNMNVIKSDPFILMSGDVVTNADIGPAMEEHKKRHQKDNSAIMTVLLKRVGGWTVTEVEAETNKAGITEAQTEVTTTNTKAKVQCQIQVSPLQPLSEDLTVALAPPQQQQQQQQQQSTNNTHSRILLYDTNPDSTSIQLPTSFFQQTAPTINIYNNMIDCGLYICSPDVLAKFSDEWDYLQIKTFISNSVAEEEEGLQTKIYAKQLSKCEYAAKIHDFRSYHAISQNLLNRWCYPIVPDNLPSGYEKVYRYGIERHMMYIEQKGKTKVGNNVTLRGPGMVGSHTKIDDNCVVKACVIGNECFIGKNVALTSCHLWEKVVVEDNASVQESILCNGCVIKKGAVVNKGCIIGRDCVVGEGVVLPEFTRITSSSVEEDDDDIFSDDSDAEGDDDEMNRESNGVVGEDGLGRVWLPTSDEIDDDSDDEENSEKNDYFEQMKSQSIGYDPTTLLRKRMKRQIEDDILMDVEYGLENEEDGDTGDDPHAASSGLNDGGPVSRIYGRQAGVDVVKELKLICLDYDFASPIENLRIELNSFKFSQNATFGDCVSGAILAILERLQLTSEISPARLVASFKNELDLWAELLDKLCFGLEEEVSVIEAIESAATGTSIAKDVLSKEPSFRFLLQTLHGKDIVSDEAIMSWAKSRREGNQDSPVGRLFNQKTTQEFLNWVEEDDDSSSDGSSSGNSSSSDSDGD